MNKKYLELTKLIRSKQNDHEILKCLSNYHENDIADMLTVMTPKERKRIYTLLVIYALSDFLIMILSWLVKQSLRAFLFQEVQP